MPVPLLPTPGSTATTDEPTHLPSSPPPPGHDLFASQAWLLPCVSAVGRGVMQTLERPRNVDISNVLAPQLSAAAAHSIAVNKIEPPPNVTAPFTSAAAAAAPDMTMPYTSPAKPTSPPSNHAQRHAEQEVKRLAALRALAEKNSAGAPNPALRWVPADARRRPAPGSVDIEPSSSTSIPLIGQPVAFAPAAGTGGSGGGGYTPLGGFTGRRCGPSPDKNNSSPAREADICTGMGGGGGGAAAASATSASSKPVEPEPEEEPDIDEDVAANAPQADLRPHPPRAAPSPAAERPQKERDLPVRPANTTTNTSRGTESRGFSRTGSWYPSPSATPPRVNSPTPDDQEQQAEEGSGAASTEKDGGAGGGGEATEEAAEEAGVSMGAAMGKSAASVVRAACEQQITSDNNTTSATTNTSAAANPNPGASDAPVSVSWQAAAYGAHHDTVLPDTVHPKIIAPMGSYPSRTASACDNAPFSESRLSGADAAAAEDAVDATDPDGEAKAETPMTTAHAFGSAMATREADMTRGTMTIHSAHMLRPRPTYLVMKAKDAVGAVGAGGKPRPRRACETIMPTSYRSVQRMEDVQDEAYDGQTVYLPPDRPTLLSHQRMRDRVTGTWRPPFVARTARTHFTSSWGDCSRVPGF